MSKVSLDQVLPVPADVVWGVVGQFNGLPEWHPAVEKSEVSQEGGKRQRTLSLAGGAQIVENLETLDDGARCLDYSIVSAGPLPVTNYKSRIEVRPEGAGCRITWSSEFDAEGAPATDAEAAVRGIYEAGFQNLKTMFGAGGR